MNSKVSIEPGGTETTAPYQEQFVCRYAEIDEFGDYDHDGHDGDCDWIRRCSVCDADVYETPCPDHAPHHVPGLRLIECDATPSHSRTWVLDDDCYEPPCPWCVIDSHAKAHEGCEHARHGRWRRWAITRRAASKLYVLGVVSGYGTANGGGCKGCVYRLSWGFSGYVLGWPRWKWRCLLVARLRAVRTRQGLSLAAVEEKSGGRWKAVVVGSWERADREPTIGKLAVIAGFYGVPVRDLLPEDAPPVPAGEAPHA